MPEQLDPGKLYPAPKPLTVADRVRIEAEVPKKLSRSQAKEKKELEEARKVNYIFVFRFDLRLI